MNFYQRLNENPRFSVLFFLALAAVLFCPLFFGKFVVGGTDVLFNHYPNILYGYREFNQFGSFSLWNRYIFSGTDFTGSIHAHFLNPLYWPLLVFPEKYIFHVLTAGFMVMNGLTGWFWSRIAVWRGMPGTGSFIVGVVAQAGMFFWFAMTTLIAVPMYLCASIVIWLIITHESRGGSANYIAMSFALGLLFVTPHPAYILGFFIPVVVVFLFQTFPCVGCRHWRGLATIFPAACMTALVLSAYRLVPVAVEIAGRGNLLNLNSGVGWPGELANHAYFGLTAFNPLVLGVSLSDSLGVSEMLKFGGGRHAQAHNALYFGILPLVVVYVAVRIGNNAKLTLLAVAYVILQSSYLYVLQPLTDIIYLLVYPLGHEGAYRPAIAIVFLFLLIDSLKVFSAATAQSVEKPIRELVVIAGLIVVAGVAMWAKAWHGRPSIVSQMGTSVIVNSFRFGMLGVLIGTALISRLPLYVFARPQSGLLGVLLGVALVAIGGNIFLASGVLSGAEMALKPLKNGFAVILVCLAVLAFVSFRPSKRRGWAIGICSIAAGTLFLLSILPSWGHGFAATAWVGMIGWGTFIALFATTLTVIGLFVAKGIDSSMAVKLMLVLTVVDLVVAFRNYSYVNVLSSPFTRKFEDIYPTQTLPLMVSDYRSNIAAEPNLPNLLVNSKFQLVSGQLANWSFGGKDMTLCPAPTVFAMKEGNAVRVCYPGSDAAGNLYQDIRLPEPFRQVAMGAWMRAESLMEVGLFLTSPSNKVGGPISRLKGDGKWHWMEAVLLREGPFETVRPHINVSKPGYVEIYAPRLIFGVVVRPKSWPVDGHEIFALKDDIPRAVDLASYRVNHVHGINRYQSNEIMTNFAMVASTPTYSGVDSDLSSDYVDFLKTFKDLDSSWFNRAGFLSILEDDRPLDLLGVGYDVDAENGGVLFRADAIPRFAAFSSYEVQGDKLDAFTRLKAVNFNPTTTVLLQEQPNLSFPSIVSDRFRLLHYETPSADQLKLQISMDSPRLVMFNDRFSPSWEAYWNGKPLRIILANTIFMAVVLPEGAGELTFVFHPSLFYKLSVISSMAAGILFLLGGIVWLRS